MAITSKSAKPRATLTYHPSQARGPTAAARQARDKVAAGRPRAPVGAVQIPRDAEHISLMLGPREVVPVGDRVSFDELLLRIHPAASRIERLSREHPCGTA